ncbi:MAG: hypothetical protein IAF58_02515 [Leptolyngbya sp.]|nr:hypothetical protein [Candidatus Melainabacteria bacterium]
MSIQNLLIFPALLVVLIYSRYIVYAIAPVTVLRIVDASKRRIAEAALVAFVYNIVNVAAFALCDLSYSFKTFVIGFVITAVAAYLLNYSCAKQKA